MLVVRLPLSHTHTHILMQGEPKKISEGSRDWCESTDGSFSHSFAWCYVCVFMCSATALVEKPGARANELVYIFTLQRIYGGRKWKRGRRRQRMSAILVFFSSSLVFFLLVSTLFNAKWTQCHILDSVDVIAFDPVILFYLGAIVVVVVRLNP